MKRATNEFTETLILDANLLLEKAKSLKNLSLNQLEERPSEAAWNVLECLEHMNKYHDFYLTEIREKIQNSKHPAVPMFKSGWFGNYSAQNMLPKQEGKVNMAMKTFAAMNPKGEQLNVAVLDKFIAQTEEFIQLLTLSKKVDLGKTKCKLTIKWLKFTLGDTLLFMVNHNKRHFIQIERILA